MPPLKVNFWELPSFRQKFPAGLQVHQRCSRITSLSQQVISLQTNVANVILVEKKLKLTFGRNSVCRCFRPQTLVLNTKSPLKQNHMFSTNGLNNSLFSQMVTTECCQRHPLLQVQQLPANWDDTPARNRSQKVLCLVVTATGRRIGN